MLNIMDRNLSGINGLFWNWNHISIYKLFCCLLLLSFEGCLQNLTINGELINLESHVPSVFGNDPSVPIPGCHRDEACVLSPCQNNGICLGGWEGYKCDCSTTFEGNNCTEGKDCGIIVLKISLNVCLYVLEVQK